MFLEWHDRYITRDYQQIHSLRALCLQKGAVWVGAVFTQNLTHVVLRTDIVKLGGEEYTDKSPSRGQRSHERGRHTKAIVRRALLRSDHAYASFFSTTFLHTWNI